MLIETRCLASSENVLSELSVSERLRSALGSDALQIRRIEVRLRALPGRYSCRLSVAFRDGGSLIINKRASALSSALSAAVPALVKAVRRRPTRARGGSAAYPLGHHRRMCVRALRGSNAAPAQPAPVRLLFALPPFGYPTHSLERAQLMALTLKMDLHLVRVLPKAHAAHTVDPDSLVWAKRDIEHLLVAGRELRCWCDSVLPERLPEPQLGVRTGEFVSEVARRAEELRARLIVVPPLGGRGGDLVAAIARASGVPVFVARPMAIGGAWLAAADLADEAYPVLRRTAELAQELSVSVVALHNVSVDLSVREAATDSAQTVPAVLEARGPRRAAQAVRRLSGAARRWAPETKVVLTHEDDPARAIVKQAAHTHVDTIVVGTRPHAWDAPFLASSVAARVVDEASRSVLVVPLADAQPA